MDMLLEKVLNNMFEFDEVENVMIATGEELEESTGPVDSDVKNICDDEDDENEGYFDQTMQLIGSTFTMEDIPVNAFTETRDFGMDSIQEDLLDSYMMDLEIDPDVEDMEDEDDEDIDDDYDAIF